MVPNGPKSSKMVHNGQKQSKMVQVVQNYQNGQKWSKGTWSKWHKTVEMVKHGGPDFKRVRRSGLSGLRARRIKSRGPKNFQLEVGDQSARRLLVDDNWI